MSCTQFRTSTLGKRHWCQLFGDYADVFMSNVTSYFRADKIRKIAVQNHFLNMFTTENAWYMNILLIVKVVSLK